MMPMHECRSLERSKTRKSERMTGLKKLLSQGKGLDKPLVKEIPVRLPFLAGRIQATADQRLRLHVGTAEHIPARGLHQDPFTGAKVIELAPRGVDLVAVYPAMSLAQASICTFAQPEFGGIVNGGTGRGLLRRLQFSASSVLVGTLLGVLGRR